MHIRQHFKRINLHEKGYKKRDIWLLQYHDFYMEYFGAFFWFYFIFSGVNSRSRPLIKVGFCVRHYFVFNTRKRAHVIVVVRISHYRQILLRGIQ